MTDLFGSKWERENGLIGGDKFYVWADKIEDMPPEQIRSKFKAMEQKFKTDAAQGRDIWPPTVAYFMALNGSSRVNEAMYRAYKPALPATTRQEIQELGRAELSKIRGLIKGQRQPRNK